MKIGIYTITHVNIKDNYAQETIANHLYSCDVTLKTLHKVYYFIIFFSLSFFFFLLMHMHYAAVVY